MAELDPHPFWLEEQSRNHLLGDSILTKKNFEYSPETLSKRLSQLNEHGKNSSFFHFRNLENFAKIDDHKVD